MAHVPIVFVSSTSDDLKDHREQAARAARASGFFPLMMEYFPASGHKPTLAACLEKVAEAEVVVVLVAHRYGWVPDGPSNLDAKSITWLECDHAWNVTGKEVLAFLVDPDYAWPAEGKEDYRLVTERERPGILEEVDRNQKKLAQFKQQLSRDLRATFTDAASVRPVVSEALWAWKQRHQPAAAEEASTGLVSDSLESKLSAITPSLEASNIGQSAEGHSTRDLFGPEEISREIARLMESWFRAEDAQTKLREGERVVVKLDMALAIIRAQKRGYETLRQEVTAIMKAQRAVVLTAIWTCPQK